jgi:hypothetical protein
MEDTMELLPIEDSPKHQLIILTLGTAAGFLAGKMVEVGYKMAIEAYRARHSTTELEG